MAAPSQVGLGKGPGSRRGRVRVETVPRSSVITYDGSIIATDGSIMSPRDTIIGDDGLVIAAPVTAPVRSQSPGQVWVLVTL